MVPLDFQIERTKMDTTNMHHAWDEKISLREEVPSNCEAFGVSV